MIRLVVILVFLTSFNSLVAQEARIFFEYNSYALTSTSKATLDSISAIEFDSIHLIGHCDNRGGNELNNELSFQRANAAKAYLLTKNPSLRISIEGKSFNQPMATNNSEASMAMNRRVEVFYHLNKKEEVSPTSPVTVEKPMPAKVINKYKCQAIDQKGIFIREGTYHIYNQKNELKNTTRFANGKFTVSDSGEVAIVRIDGKGYFSQIIEYNRLASYCVVRLQEIKKNSYFTFKHLGFVPNDSIILDSSFPELEGLLQTLEQNPKLSIHIEGHTNGVNTTQSPQWHHQISTGRAKSVYTYLIEKGIDERRLSYEGYGCKKMIYPSAINQTEAQANRRVEIKVISF